MALLAFPSLSRWHNCPIERRRTVGGLMNQLLEDFDDSLQPFWDYATANQNSFGEIVDDKENFGIQLDVSHFRPEELTVKMQDETLYVEGHHEERNDQHGSVERHFIRKYTIPETVLQNSLESQLSDQGILRITAKKKAIESPKASILWLFIIKWSPDVYKKMNKEKIFQMTNVLKKFVNVIIFRGCEVLLFHVQKFILAKRCIFYLLHSNIATLSENSSSRSMRLVSR
ncbi:Small heat shock protein [Dirofilaria immitis]